MPGLVVVVLMATLAPSEARADLARFFGDHEGTMVVLDTATNRRIEVRPERAALRLPPCSTFKIPNALISLQAGAIDPEDSTLAWDPQRDPATDDWPRSWSGDHDLESAIRNSVVWYFQELARRVGPEEMQGQLDRIGYGNADISGGIDRFWLWSSLRISAREQVGFLRRFRGGELGFDPSFTQRVRRAIVLERGPTVVLSGKTGLCRRDDGGFLGWVVGYAERDDDVAFYALNLEGADFRTTFRERMRVTRDILRELGYLDPEPEPRRSP